jgi:hypothetical protein
MAGGPYSTHENTDHCEPQYLVRAQNRIAINSQQPLPVYLPFLAACSATVRNCQDYVPKKTFKRSEYCRFQVIWPNCQAISATGIDIFLN